MAPASPVTVTACEGGSQLEFHIEAQFFARGQRDAFADELVEAGLFHGQVVEADLEILDAVEARGSGIYGSLHSGGNVDGDDVSLGHHGALRVGDYPADGCEIGLRKYNGRNTKRQSYECCSNTEHTNLP
jgi:hypothetical protein